MADWTPDQAWLDAIARSVKEDGELYLGMQRRAQAMVDLAQRGLSAEQDAAKARALERYVAAKRMRDNDETYTDADADEFIAARRAMFALCPEPKTEGETCKHGHRYPAECLDCEDERP